MSLKKEELNEIKRLRYRSKKTLRITSQSLEKRLYNHLNFNHTKKFGKEIENFDKSVCSIETLKIFYD